MSKRAFSKEFKLGLIKEHDEEGVSFYKLDKDNHLAFGTVRKWKTAYIKYGEDGLVQRNCMLCQYSAGLKQQVVEEYLAGGVSLHDLAHKYGIRAESTVLNWIRLYNKHEELTDSRPERGKYLMVKKIKPRKTTQDERIKIVEYCIANAKNYARTAEKFKCSYGQVYSWVKKYEVQGVDGLCDRRGKNKPAAELTEIEKLKAENRLLKAQTKQKQMEIDFLKKLDAVERR